MSLVLPWRAIKPSQICLGIRTLHCKSIAQPRPVPPKTERIQSPEDLFKAAGHNLTEHLSLLGEEVTWEDLFAKYRGQELKKLGFPTKQRRYLLWVLHKYSNNEPFVLKEKPKKTIRGHGPAIQNGVLIRRMRKAKKSV